MHGREIRRKGLFNADVSALSAFSLLEMPTWLGRHAAEYNIKWVSRKIVIF